MSVSNPLPVGVEGPTTCFKPGELAQRCDGHGCVCAMICLCTKAAQLICWSLSLADFEEAGSCACGKPLRPEEQVSGG